MHPQVFIQSTNFNMIGPFLTAPKFKENEKIPQVFIQ